MVSWATAWPCCSGQTQDLVPWVLAALAPAVAKRDQGTVWAVASEGTSPKPWQLPHGIGPAGVQKSRAEAWQPLPRFQRIYGNAWMSRQKSAAGSKPSWRTSTSAMQRENVGLEPPHRVPSGALPTRAVRRELPSCRPQTGRSTKACTVGLEKLWAHNASP
uniref:Uncharacterized protein n=2 Tax=Macaca TaxID=9539 RepID=A0A5F8ABY5_MACMU